MGDKGGLAFPMGYPPSPLNVFLSPIDIFFVVIVGLVLYVVNQCRYLMFWRDIWERGQQQAYLTP